MVTPGRGPQCSTGDHFLVDTGRQTLYRGTSEKATRPGEGWREGRADLLASGGHRRRLSILEACSENAIWGLNTPSRAARPSSGPPPSLSPSSTHTFMRVAAYPGEEGWKDQAPSLGLNLPLL